MATSQYENTSDIVDEFFLHGHGNKDGRVSPFKLNQRGVYTEFRDYPVVSTKASLGGAATAATGAVNRVLIGPTYFEQVVLGDGQDIPEPVLSASGLDISGDQASADGFEFTNGILARTRGSFVVGTDGGWYFTVRLTPADASGFNPLIIGFRKAATYQAAYGSYTDFAAIGIVGTSDPNLIKTGTQVGGGGQVTTDTLDTWANGVTKSLTVLVSATGAVTYQINGAAPTASAAYSFTSGLTLVPFLYFLHGGDFGGALNLLKWECGPQSQLGS